MIAGKNGILRSNRRQTVLRNMGEIQEIKNIKSHNKESLLSRYNIIDIKSWNKEI